MSEFLPLCDVLFNVISLAGYFCDVVFDVVLGYALLERGRVGYFTIVISLVLLSLIVSQIVSFRWYWNNMKRKRADLAANSAQANDNGELAVPEKKDVFGDCGDSQAMRFKTYSIIAVHAIQCGVLWRYAKLFVPVNLRRVKHEVRDLCMLRLVHGFCEAAPMLLLQLYLLITIQSDSKFLSEGSEVKLKTLSGKTYSPGLTITQQSSLAQQQTEKTFKDLNVVSASLSLFSVCWALASFSKNVRLQKVHRLVLTWLGVIFQFIWRLGTVTSRIASLTVYASVYKYWVFLVIILHWFSMLLWLISPKNVFHGERISKVRKTLLSALIAFVYIFAYINLQEVNHRQKMFTFYIVMFLENALLVSLWLAGIWDRRTEQWHVTPLLILGTFVIGIFFMLLYYRFFHVRRLNWESGGRYPSNENEFRSNNNRKGTGKIDGSTGQPAIAGVFNCRFTNPVGNAATKRKKKKPTTFIPPPNLRYTPQLGSVSSIITNGAMAMPFWRRPLSRSQAGSSENEGSSAGSRVNIHQKLQEKKQKQLAELKIIEEEIKQGKLGGPTTNTLSSGDDGRTSLPRQPIPRTKKHTNLLDAMEWCTANPGMLEKSFSDFDEMNNLNKYCADELYSSFGLSGINIPALEQQSPLPKPVASSIPSSSQLSAAESNSLTRHAVHARTKIPHNVPLNPILFENYCSNQHGSANGNFDHLNRQNIFHEINHPRQISGTYSSNTAENPKGGLEGGLPFPYNVLPPPRSKLDSRSTPPTPSITITQQQQKQQQQQQQSPQKLAAADFLSKLSQRQYQRAKTPEVLLAPHYLDNSRVYYDWVGREHPYRSHHNPDRVSSGDENLDVSAADDSVLGLNEPVGHRASSDIDSQVSLPRSYTLPREFKYYRRNKPRKIIKTETFITSTNSSDGDVDSGDENESEGNSHSDDSQCKAVPPPNSRIASNNFHNHNGHNRSQNRILTAASTAPIQHHQLPPQPIVKKTLQIGSSNSKTASPLNEGPSIAVNNLDLISGVSDVGHFSQFSNRPRVRTYGLSKSTATHLPYCRHETKL
ncbi:uncharacterized protein LOC129918559 [Episyrphus balteatus]|uniref:uncharacterized protein LOC129918559 n=1 Tax=Episyrphus balteatus TaxID=286459 RepID=UPI0024858E1D|nr:uncharacterized protein LOC129918559 [Episyrphus balteatus]